MVKRKALIILVVFCFVLIFLLVSYLGTNLFIKKKYCDYEQIESTDDGIIYNNNEYFENRFISVHFSARQYNSMEIVGYAYQRSIYGSFLWHEFRSVDEENYDVVIGGMCTWGGSCGPNIIQSLYFKEGLDVNNLILKINKIEIDGIDYCSKHNLSLSFKYGELYLNPIDNIDCKYVGMIELVLLDELYNETYIYVKGNKYYIRQASDDGFLFYEFPESICEQFNNLLN